MPRRPPGAIRVQPWAREPASRIDGLSAGALRVLAQLEAQELGRGSVAQALVQYRQWLAMPGRWRYDTESFCSACDVCQARDVIEAALRGLPRGARAELRRIVAPLDERLWHRTLPDPNRDATPFSLVDDTSWWHHRLQH